MSIPLPHETNSIVFAQYLDEHRGPLWLTWSTMNKRQHFCEEPDCSAVAYSSLGYRCEAHYHAYIAQGRIAQLAEERNAERLQLEHHQEHRCSGDFDYGLGHVVCDFSDEHDCPQYKGPSQKCCADCGTERKELEPELHCNWYCKPCWQVRFGKKETTVAQAALVVALWQTHVAALTQCRHCHTRNTELRHEPVSDVFYLDCTACNSTHSVDKALLNAIPIAAKKSCTDCGYTPEDGHFPCYRGDDPLCSACEENAYGPPEEEDWRERTGRCTRCDLFYDLRCSSDRRDLCYSCPPSSLAKARLGSRTSVSYEEDDDGSECPGCGCFIRDGLAGNGYCAVCWQEKFE